MSKRIMTGVLGSLAAFSLMAYSSTAKATWYNDGSCVTNIGSNIAISCTQVGTDHDYGLQDYYDNGFGYYWETISTGGARQISQDLDGNMFLVNNAGQMYYGYLTSGTTASYVEIDGGAATFKSVGAGNPNYSRDEVWATDTSGNVYMWTGYLNGNTVESGSWIQVAAVPNGAAKVGVFGEITSGACAIHVPWVIDTNNNIYQYEYTSTSSCTATSSCAGGCWVQQSGAAIDITNNDFVLGTNHAIYQWTSSGWSSVLSPYVGGNRVLFYGIGSQLNEGNGVEAFDSSGATWVN
jgi:hypothetical protein